MWLDGSGEDEAADERQNPYVMFPVRHPDIWNMYKKAQSAFWTAEEIDLSKDINDWNELTDKERHFIKHVLAFFAASDGIVNENLAVRFMSDVDLPEVRAFYGFQIAMENIHSETYALLIDTYISDKKEKSDMFDAINKMPCIKRKADWALGWISSTDASFAQRLVAFACVEGIFFSGSFCSIFWLKERGVMHGLCSSNEFISRDEALHTEFAILLYSKIPAGKRLAETVVTGIVKEAVDIELDFIVSSLPCSLLGMNALVMSSYIKFVADRLLVQLGYEKVYNERNPFAFMDRICLVGKANFFEQRESNYSKAQDANRSIVLTDDF
jgi:ribonucleotide reductase beta subunit family protein with ferritin-like domain